MSPLEPIRLTDVFDVCSADTLRILFAGHTWFGADDRACCSALRRLGHSVLNFDQRCFMPQWRSRYLRAIRRIVRPLLVTEVGASLLAEAQIFDPHFVLIFKGTYIPSRSIRTMREELGVKVFNFYPDVSFLAHGPYIPQAMREYDWIFTTKTFMIEDLRHELGVENVEFLPHGFDPEVHRPVPLVQKDIDKYGCDVVHVGTWSPKKERVLSELRKKLPHIHFKIWGNQWNRCRNNGLNESIQGVPVYGVEYSRAIRAAKIFVVVLSEAYIGASSGDRMTAKTFQVPACGGFMLHERTQEVLDFFHEGREIACFDSPDELAEKVEYYLANEKERLNVAAAGQQRCVDSDYSVDARMKFVVARYRDTFSGGDNEKDS